MGCACEGSGLHAPYENRMPGALRWSRGRDASAGEQLQCRSSLAKRLDCTETIINQLLANSYQNPTSERQVPIKLHLVAGCKATPPPSTEISPSMKLVPGAKKAGYRCLRVCAWRVSLTVSCSSQVNSDRLGVKPHQCLHDPTGTEPDLFSGTVTTSTSSC